MSDNPKILYMNKSTSENDDDVPFPVKQQLGDHGDLKDARSGNGVGDYDEDLGGSTQTGGTSVREVTYHLEGASQPTYVTGQSNDAESAEQPLQPYTTQRGQDGRDKRIVDSGAGQDPAAGQADGKGSTIAGHSSASGNGGNGGKKTAQSSAKDAGRHSQPDATSSGSDGESAQQDVPSGSTDDVLEWVGDDTARARAALEVENRREQPRRSLVARLNDRV